MSVTRFVFTVLGLVAIVVPARASLTFQSSQTSFTTDADSAGLTVSSEFTFTGGTFSSFDGVSDAEYTVQGVEFVLFNSSGSTAENWGSQSGGTLDVPNGLNDAIEVIFPSNVYGFGFNFTTSSGLETVCVDPTTAFSNCDSGGTAAPGFIGTLSTTPSLAQITNLWIHPLASGSTDLSNFELATQSEASTPEATTTLLLGSGLILLALVRRRRIS